MFQILERYRKGFRQILLRGAALWPAAGAQACTLCEAGPEGDGFNATRAAIFDAAFYPNLFLTLLPFVALPVAVVAIRLLPFGGSPPATAQGGEGPDNAGHPPPSPPPSVTGKENSDA